MIQYSASFTGSQVGVADISKRMEAQIKACGDIRFALAGYSQGAGVFTRAIATLPDKLVDLVVAVALYGGGNGSQVKEPLKQRTIANCAPGDFVSSASTESKSQTNVLPQACPNGGTGPGYVSYNDRGTIWHDRSTKYIIDAFHGKKWGLKTMRSPTDMKALE
jgi:pimeloyl-ACP methyl ester carboxylesterase